MLVVADGRDTSHGTLATLAGGGGGCFQPMTMQGAGKGTHRGQHDERKMMEERGGREKGRWWVAGGNSGEAVGGGRRRSVSHSTRRREGVGIPGGLRVERGGRTTAETGGGAAV